MAKLVLDLSEVPNGAKLKRAVETHALELGQTVEQCLLPTLRGIAEQVGINANDDETDQEASLAKAERRAARTKQARDERNAEALRLAAESESRRKSEEAKAAEAVALKTEPIPNTK